MPALFGKNLAMTDPAERRLMTKLSGALLVLVVASAVFTGNRTANIVIGVLILTLGTYMIVRSVRLRKKGMS
jgi:hypothetical protein